MAVAVRQPVTHIVREPKSLNPLCADHVLGPDVPTMTLAEIYAGSRARFCAACVKRFQRIRRPPIQDQRFIS